MRPLEAQCRFRPGRLSQEAGKGRDACEELNTAVSMFREMGMHFWLEKAESALSKAL